MYRPPLGLFLLAGAALGHGSQFHATSGKVYTLSLPSFENAKDLWAFRDSFPTRYEHTRRTSQAKRRRIARMHNPHGCPPRPASRVK